MSEKNCRNLIISGSQNETFPACAEFVHLSKSTEAVCMELSDKYPYQMRHCPVGLSDPRYCYEHCSTRACPIITGVTGRCPPLLIILYSLSFDGIIIRSIELDQVGLRS